MPISAHVLERAYQMIHAGQYQNAELVLDAVVRVDPQNVMAWKAYLQVYQNRCDLEWLMERIIKVKELSDKDKSDILLYHARLLQGLSQRSQNNGEENLISTPPQQTETEIPAQEGKVTFELIEEFDYPVRKAERIQRKKRRQFFTYHVPTYVWQGLGLLALFYFGVHFLVLKNLFGYFLMGAFIVSGVSWLRQLNEQKIITPIKTLHTYSLESEKELIVIDKPAAQSKLENKGSKKITRRKRKNI
ncbi:MAG: hypothetical protein HZB50_14630 [Chloroflexi bacterium]|nr:hypothetical protein [Chloroflexota bacterium]